MRSQGGSEVIVGRELVRSFGKVIRRSLYTSRLTLERTLAITNGEKGRD